MHRRQFHQTVAATAAALAAGGQSAHAAAPPVPLPPDPVPAGATARLGCNRLWHQWPASNPGLNDLTFSPDGRFLATLGYQDDHVFVWSVPDGRAVRDWDPQAVDRGGSLLWTDRGLYVASDGGLSLWEPLTATLIHRFPDASPVRSCRGLAVSPDGRWVATTSFVAGTVRLWDTTTHQPVAELFAEIDGRRRLFPEAGDILVAVAFSRCGRWLAAGGYGQPGVIDGVVHAWDIAARRHLVRLTARTGPVQEMAFTPAGRLLTAGWTGAIAVWDPLGRSPVPDGLGPLQHYHGLAANAAGRIAVQRADGVYLWDPDPARETLLCPARTSGHLAYSDDGRFVAVGRGTGRVDLYDAATGADLSPPDRHATHVHRIEVTADGTVCLASLGYPSPQHDHETVLRDLRSGARLGGMPPADFWPLALAPVGTRIAGRLGESPLAVWDWVSGEVTTHPDLNPRAAAWNPDGKTLVVATADGAVATWDLATGGGRRQPVPNSAPIMALAVAAGDRAAVLTDRGELLVWRLDRDEPPRRLPAPGPLPKHDYLWPRWPLALAPDGLSAAVTLGDGTVYAGPVDGDELRAVYTHPAGDESSEDGLTLVPRYTRSGRLLIAGTSTALRDNRWWYTGVVADGMTGEVLWRTPPQRLWANALALTPDGRALLTGHEDGTLLVWPVDR